MRIAILVSLTLAAVAHAQVKPVEPFGGRPFGASADAPAPAEPTPRAALAQPMQVPAAPPPTIVMQPGSTAVLGAAPQVAPAPAPVAPPPPAPVPAPAPVAAGAGAGSQPLATGAPPTGTPPVPAVAPAPAAPAVAAPSTARGTPTAAPGASTAQQAPVRGLPADAPRIVVSGGTWSSDASKRLLIVNGQVVHEGADVGGGVVVQEVTRNGAVLGYKGSRYTVLF